MSRAAAIYAGSDGAATKALYGELEACGTAGRIAMNLFRAQKCSARAKVYRGGLRGMGSFRHMAYERKEWSMGELVSALEAYRAKGLRPVIDFGWKADPTVVFDGEPSWVLYVDTPVGQVSFHCPRRLAGPDYAGEWDGQHASERRVIEFAGQVLAAGNTAMEMFA